MKFSMSFLVFFIISALYSQERVLLHIGKNGQQEAYPLKRGEHAKDVIERLEKKKTLRTINPSQTAGLVDTLKYFSSYDDLNVNFGWTHQDVALQWYESLSLGTVKEFWWYNYHNRGAVKRGRVRAWHIDPRVTAYPTTPVTKYLGTFKDSTDDDGGVQPFPPTTGDRWFYSNGAADSTVYSFNFFKKEAAWLPGGLEKVLDSNVWQGIKLEEWGEPMNVMQGEVFGFTISNDTKKSDLEFATDTRMEILSMENTLSAPFHSFKFYETGRTASSNAGWHLRGDYEWGMYVVMEYTSIPGLRIDKLETYSTTLSGSPREIVAWIFDDNPGGGPSQISMYLLSKVGKNSMMDTVLMVNSGQKYSGYTPAAKPNDTVFWSIKVSSISGQSVTIPMRSYYIFQKQKNNLLLNNSPSSLLSNANMMLNEDNSEFDIWTTRSDGMSELDQLFGLYSNILIVDGDHPISNVSAVLHNRMKSATSSKPLSLFFSSPDYGCIIIPNCIDSVFSIGSLEYDYFGVSKIGPQDLPPYDKEFRILPVADTITNYLIRYSTDSGTTLWHDPYFEHNYWGFPDALLPRPEAKALFLDGDSNAIGIKYITDKTRSVYLAFDAGSLQFRSDTSLLATDDPKYAWIGDVGHLATSFFNSYKVTSVKIPEGTVPEYFHLVQNYPNPFNPSTTIEYSIPQKSDVQVTIYNMLGQKVAVLVNEKKDPGRYRVQWNATRMASGLYFYELRADNFTGVKKMLFLK